MKKLCLFLVGCWLIALPTYAQVYGKLAYQKSVPLGDMGRQIQNNAHGIGLEVGLKVTNTPITLGWHWAVLGYGYQKTEELYVFSQGAQSLVAVEISNYFRQSHFFVHWDLRQKGWVRPYLSLGVGRSRFETKMNIEATTSTAECPKPIEQRSPSKDRVPHFMMGGGVKFDLTKVFFDGSDERNLSLIIHFQHIRGRETEYLNVRQPNTTPQAQPVYTRFASQARPEVVYDYYAGNRYVSPVRLLTVQMGIAYVFPWDAKPKKYGLNRLKR